MYEISELTGNIYFNGVLVPQDDTNPMWQAYWQHKQNGGEIVFVEATDEEIAEQAGNKPIRNISEVLKLTVVFNTKPKDGDVWLESNTNTGLKIRINGVTKTINLI